MNRRLLRRIARQFGLVALFTGTLFVMPVVADSQHVVCDISFAKSFLNRVVQIIGGGYATLTLLAILGEKAISSIPLIPQDTRQTLIEWRRRIILGAVVIYAGVPMLYQVLLDAGAPFPACLEILPI
jgi:hypothetical protein